MNTECTASPFTVTLTTGQLSVFYNNVKIKEVPAPENGNLSKVVVGKVLFENNPLYTTQHSTTQGLSALNIFNHYDVPILINDFVIEPHCQLRYTGIYNNGIPYGELLHSLFDEDVCIVNPATDVHYGLVIFP
jgi:hypothetical protein